MKNKFLFGLNDKGERIVSLLLGINGDTMQELKHIAKEHDAVAVVEGDDDMLQKFCNGYVYLDNQLVLPCPDVLSESEARLNELEQHNQELEAGVNELLRAYALASLSGDEELIAELKEEYSELMKHKEGDL